jgi:hypothetical protein
MVISERWLVLVLILLASWLVLICRTSWKLLKTPFPRAGYARPIRSYLTIAGIGSSALAVGTLLALHLSWISVGISQHLGVAAIKIISLLLFCSTLAGLVLSVLGSGRIRWLGVGTCLVTGLWWLTLAFGAAISMGAPTIARHPTHFLIPQGYVGWVKIDHGQSGPPLEMSNGAYICRIPASGVLQTSSSLEDGWAKDEYFYYSADGSLSPLPETGWGGGGMIWGGNTKWQLEGNGTRPKQLSENFYVGLENQYHRNESRPTESPSSSPISR